MSEYKYRVANDNGNSEQKIIINNVMYRQPNVYAILHNGTGETDASLEVAIANIYENIDVRIESSALSDSDSASRYMIGKLAIESSRGSELYNMEIDLPSKDQEDLPIINTLGILAAKAISDKYSEDKTLLDGDTINIEIDMTTALPAENHDSEAAEAFANRFTKHLHEVKFYIKDMKINVQVKFNDVKVMKEGVPALFSIIEDGAGNYRNDDLFDQMKSDYNYEKLNGTHFSEKRLLHLDIGDGTTELVYTSGYSTDPTKTEGLSYGIGQAIEKAAVKLRKKLKIKISRQKYASYLKDENHKFHKSAVAEVMEPKKEVAVKLYKDTISHIQKLNYEIDILVVYGGASILLNDVLYGRLKEFCDEFGIEILWVPSKYAVEMTSKGMDIHIALMIAEASKELSGRSQVK